MSDNQVFNNSIDFYGIARITPEQGKATFFAESDAIFCITQIYSVSGNKNYIFTLRTHNQIAIEQILELTNVLASQYADHLAIDLKEDFLPTPPKMISQKSIQKIINQDQDVQKIKSQIFLYQSEDMKSQIVCDLYQTHAKELHYV